MLVALTVFLAGAQLGFSGPRGQWKTSLFGPLAVVCARERQADNVGGHLLCPRAVREQHNDVARAPATADLLDLWLAVVVVPRPQHFFGARRRAHHVEEGKTVELPRRITLLHGSAGLSVLGLGSVEDHSPFGERDFRGSLV
jgi:hypothetical protein